jgi:hypothetical protein
MRRLVEPMNVTITNATPAVFTMVDSSKAAVAHGLIDQVPVVFSTTGTLPSGVTAGTTYYVIAEGLTATAFEVSAADYVAGNPLPADGAAVNTTTAGLGTHSVKGLEPDINTHIWINDANTYLVTHNSMSDVQMYTTLAQWADVNSAVNAIIKAWGLSGFRDCPPQKPIPTVKNTFSWGSPYELTTKTVTLAEFTDIGHAVVKRDRARRATGAASVPIQSSVAQYPRVISLAIA